MKRLFIAFLGFIFCGMILWMMVDIKEEIVDTVSNIQKKVVVYNIRFYGYQGKQLAMKLRALSGWSGNDLDEAYLNDIVDGEMYNEKGQAVMYGLKAKKVYSHARYENIIAQGGICAFFEPKAYAGEKSGEKTRLEADQLKYDSRNKRAYIENNVHINQGDTDIYADKAEVLTEENIAYIFGNVNLTNNDLVMTSNRMVSYLDEERTVVTGGVKLVWVPDPEAAKKDKRTAEIRSKETTVTCADIEYSTKGDTEQARLTGGVVIQQTGKRIQGDEAQYRGEENKLYLTGDVVIELASADWLLKDSTKARLKEKDIRESLQATTRITADEAVFNRETNDIEISGDVHIDQPKNESYAQRVIYFDATEEFDLIDRVQIRKKEGDWIAASRAKMFLGEEIFEAYGNISTEFRMKKKE